MRLKFSSSYLAVIGLSMAALGFAAEPTDMDGANTPNGKLAVEYMNEVFNGSGPQAAQQQYFSSDLLVTRSNRPPDAAANRPAVGVPEKRSMSIKKVVVQGDLVFIQGHGVRGDKNELQWELFRIKDGKIVELWSLHNEIPLDQMGKQW